MPLTYFTAIYDLKAIVVPDSLGTNPDPFTQAITGLAEFKPSLREIWSETDERFYYLTPIQARIDQGVLADIPRRALDSTVAQELPGDPPNHRRYGIRLTANGDAFGPLPILDWKVTFTKVVFDKKDQRLSPFTFEAPIVGPGTQTTVDLAIVHHVTRRRNLTSRV